MSDSQKTIHILCLINVRHIYGLFYPLLCELTKDERKVITLCVQPKDDFSDLPMDPSWSLIPFDSKVLESYSFDCILTSEIWSGRVKVMLKPARSKNIPVLMLDHGSLTYPDKYHFTGGAFHFQYRSNVTLATHVLCWGERGKEYWLSCGALSDKFEVVGSPQYDQLYQSSSVSTDKSQLWASLGLSEQKKTIMYSATTRFPEKNLALRNDEAIKQLKRFVNQQEKWQLILKYHPLDMFHHEKCPEPLDFDGCVVTGRFEHRWPETHRVELNDVIKMIDVVVLMMSSAVIAPIILKKPIIHAEQNTESSQFFSNLGKDVFHRWLDGETIDSVIDSLDTAPVKADQAYEDLADSFNSYGGQKASQHIEHMINRVVKEKKSGINFYPLSEEEELLKTHRHYPSSPHPYQNIVVYYARQGQIELAGKWFEKYQENFKEASPLFVQMAQAYLSGSADAQKVDQFLSYWKIRGFSCPADDLWRWIMKVINQQSSFQALPWLKFMIKVSFLKRPHLSIILLLALAIMS